MRKIKAHELRINDHVINAGTVEKILNDGQVIRVTYTDGRRASYARSARLHVQDLTDTVDES